MKVLASDLPLQWGKVQAMALDAPVALTRDGRDSMVLMSADEFSRLKRRDREVLSFADFSPQDLVAIGKARAPADAAAFDHEVTD